MLFQAVSCPQCGGALPRQAMWRMVKCPFCGAMVTRSEDLVQAGDFHAAWLRAQSGIEPAAQRVDLAGRRFRLLATQGGGEHATIHLAERMDVLPERVVIKVAREVDGAGRLVHEHDILLRLQTLDLPGSAYFSQRLPQPVCAGVCAPGLYGGQEALVWRYPVGYWGSLAEVMHYHPGGLDARHVVWIWRRVLEVLGYVHSSGWVHGRLHAAHWLVQPRDHGILLVGWGEARRDTSSAAQVRDLQQAAWTARWLLCGGEDLPVFPIGLHAGLQDVLLRASVDAAWCARQGAGGIDEALCAAAREAFGAPRFVPFSPLG